MNILLIHYGFPGQFKYLIPRLQEKGYKFWVISKNESKIQQSEIKFHTYELVRGNAKDVHPLCQELESKTIRGEAVAIQALALKKEGFNPSLILGHPGWGEMLFLADIWPDVPQLHYVEFFHGVPGTDDDFDGGFDNKQDWWERARARMKNSHHLTNLNTMTAGLCPTYFQHSLLPKWAANLTQVVHDGIDTKWLRPDLSTTIKIAPNKYNTQGLTLRSGDPVITFVNRTFEPYRGIHIFLEALIDIQSKHPTVQSILVGNDTANVSYGKQRDDGKGWLSALREQHGEKLDWSRIHPLGVVPHKILRSIYQVSSAHVYLSYPFVLSWSMLEAMSSGCLVIGSDTDPVKEVIKHGHNGLLVPFKSSKELSDSVLWSLRPNNYSNSIKSNARKTIIEKYELGECLQKQVNLIEDII